MLYFKTFWLIFNHKIIIYKKDCRDIEQKRNYNNADGYLEIRISHFYDSQLYMTPVIDVYGFDGWKTN